MAVPNLVTLLATVMFSLETPYFLVSVNQEEEARQVLCRLRGEGSSAEEVQGEFKSILKRKMVLKERSGEQAPTTAAITMKLTRMWATLCSARFWRPFSIVGVANTLTAFTGVDNLAMFIVNIFQESGASIDPYWGAVVVSACWLAASTCSSVALKHVCRRKLFLGCSSVQFACLSLIAVSSYAKSAGVATTAIMRTALDQLPLVGLAGICLSFPLGIQSVLCLLCGEIFPTDVRSFASAIVLVCSGTGLAVAGMTFPFMLKTLGYADFHFLGAIRDQIIQLLETKCHAWSAGLTGRSPATPQWARSSCCMRPSRCPRQRARALPTSSRCLTRR